MAKTRWTAADVERVQRKMAGEVPVKPQNLANKGSKYGNRKVTYDGIKFDSQGEANRYAVLKQREKQGIIWDLKLQPQFELNEGGTFSFKYRADFSYWENGNCFIVEDFKGMETAVFKKKKKLMKKVHGIDIRITKKSTN